MIDHDVRVLARRAVRVKAFWLGGWIQVQRLCAERGLPLVCIQPLMSHVAREQQDYTTHKTGEPDCVMIARLAVELHCYIPEELDESWAHLRHLGRHRVQLITAETGTKSR